MNGVAAYMTNKSDLKGWKPPSSPKTAALKLHPFTKVELKFLKNRFRLRKMDESIRIFQGSASKFSKIK